MFMYLITQSFKIHQADPSESVCLLIDPNLQLDPILFPMANQKRKRATCLGLIKPQIMPVLPQTMYVYTCLAFKNIRLCLWTKRYSVEINLRG